VYRCPRINLRVNQKAGPPQSISQSPSRGRGRPRKGTSIQDATPLSRRFRQSSNASAIDTDGVDTDTGDEGLYNVPDRRINLRVNQKAGSSQPIPQSTSRGRGRPRKETSPQGGTPLSRSPPRTSRALAVDTDGVATDSGDEGLYNVPDRRLNLHVNQKAGSPQPISQSMLRGRVRARKGTSTQDASPLSRPPPRTSVASAIEADGVDTSTDDEGWNDAPESPFHHADAGSNEKKKGPVHKQTKQIPVALLSGGAPARYRDGSTIPNDQLPWNQLTNEELAKLRKRMKKNAEWTPSATMIARELESFKRGPINKDNFRDQWVGKPKVVIVPEDGGIGDPQKLLPDGGEVARENKGMRLNRAKKRKREEEERERERGNDRTVMDSVAVGTKLQEEGKERQRKEHEGTRRKKKKDEDVADFAREWPEREVAEDAPGSQEQEKAAVEAEPETKANNEADTDAVAPAYAANRKAEQERQMKNKRSTFDPVEVGTKHQEEGQERQREANQVKHFKKNEDEEVGEFAKDRTGRKIEEEDARGSEEGEKAAEDAAAGTKAMGDAKADASTAAHAAEQMAEQERQVKNKRSALDPFEIGTKHQEEGQERQRIEQQAMRPAENEDDEVAKFARERQEQEVVEQAAPGCEERENFEADAEAETKAMEDTKADAAAAAHAAEQKAEREREVKWGKERVSNEKATEEQAEADAEAPVAAAAHPKMIERQKSIESDDQLSGVSGIGGLVDAITTTATKNSSSSTNREALSKPMPTSKSHLTRPPTRPTGGIPVTPPQRPNRSRAASTTSPTVRIIFGARKHYNSGTAESSGNPTVKKPNEKRPGAGVRRKKRGGAEVIVGGGRTANADEYDQGEDLNPYCLCDKVSDGTMIACDNDNVGTYCSNILFPAQLTFK